MAFDSFPSQLYVKTLDSSEEALLGTFNPSNHTELEHIHIMLYINGTLGGSEQVRVNIHSNEDLDVAIYTSDWSDLSDISNIGQYWIGWLRCDFNRNHINKDSDYYVTIETNNYTRNGDTFYLSVVLEWPITYNDQADSLKAAPAALMYGYRDL